MTKIGVKVALINTAIKQESLVHCIKVSGCKMMFFGTELEEQVRDVASDLAELNIQLYSEGSNLDFCESANQAIRLSSDVAVSTKHVQGIGFSDTFGYIYTSGTTGLPKAAVILHQKMFAFGALMVSGFLVKETDIVYTSLPLFHSAGGGLGLGMMLYSGCSVVIKKRFSASDFWKDCIKYKCTVVQYIGECCRYLLQQPPSSDDSQHCVRLAVGNGLRPEIWGEFQERFNIPEIGEFYGSTEGNGALINHCTSSDARGACGRMGTLLTKITGVKFVKFDVIEEEPIRDKDGFCMECQVDEPGELLFPIKANDPSTRFAGYSDPAATSKKILSNVFVQGDSYFRTGDLLSKDSKGYIHFVDRIGDTFRWKGENCSTTEVTQVISTFPGVEECNVYGVQIPNNLDGRAPCCAITPVDGSIDNIDMRALAHHAQTKLPSYAVPLFLRIQPQIAVTATMKHQKVELRKQGIDINLVTDPLYWLSPSSKVYEPLTEAVYEAVCQQRARL